SGKKASATSRKNPTKTRSGDKIGTGTDFFHHREERMAKGYLVTCYRKINDQQKWAAYAKLAGPAIQKAGGRFIVRGSPGQTYERGVQERGVIVELDSGQQAVAAPA